MLRLCAFTLGLLLVSFAEAVHALPAVPVPQLPAVDAMPTLTAQFSPENPNLTQLFSRIWRVTDAPAQPAPGSLFIFLPNGTLLETSCVETYRIATWTIDKSAPTVLRVMEDGQLAFTAAITELTDTTLKLQNTLVRSNEQQTVTLTAVEEEFVCPDLPR
jgi:hypothetical protein